MQRIVISVFVFWVFVSQSVAQPGIISEHLKIDQFGYPPDVQKICVINNPIIGFDQNDPYVPGATLQLIRASDNVVIHTGPAVSWKNGATYDQSGDKLWWYDFSSVTTPGTYYIYDPANNKRSFEFDIAGEVYREVLRHAVRMFYYQRSGYEKLADFAGVWSDGASHLGPQQDLDCRLVTNPVPSTTRQVQGGWYDAGDYNKYVNFAYEPIHDLSLAYIEQPEIWTDDYNIPESGNGIPDLLDELKWETDWLLRMQESNGSVLMKVSVTDFTAASPPSADTGFRRYGAAQASATRAAASMYAIAAIAFDLSSHPDMMLYADTLEQAAVDAWNWLVANPGFSYYSNSGFASANPEVSEYQQTSFQVGAAIALYSLTGNTVYRSYVDDHYDEMHPLQWTFWYPWESIIQDLLLYYSVLPGATVSVKNAIRSSFSNSMTNSGHLIPAITGATGGYRGFMGNGDNVWGSNRPRGHTGSMFYNALAYGISNDIPLYRNAAMGYVNFLHGVNPISMVMLTNMDEVGAEKSANEMYHSWFAHNTPFDNAQTSAFGPAPGYQPGGFNPHYHPDPSYNGDIVPPELQPSLKSYKDWNTSWPENSWEVTETSISNQGSYVKLLSRFVPAPCVKRVTNPFDAGNFTLRRALECALPGDTIRISISSADTLYIDDNPIVIADDVVILHDQPGNFNIHCRQGEAGIVLLPGKTAHLYNITFSGTGNGLLRNEGNLHLHDVKFQTTGLSGPAIFNASGEARIHGLVEVKAY